jgi:tetratricopeptide (TPR) repeat protein
MESDGFHWMRFKLMENKYLSIFKIFHLILFTVFILMPIHIANAETRTFSKEYTYRAGEEDGRISSSVIAVREVKRLLLAELSTYLESQTKAKDFPMTKDQIIALTAVMVSPEVTEETFDGKAYRLKAKITVNPQDVINSIDNLRKDRNKVKELEGLSKKVEELSKENEQLRKDLKKAKGKTKQEEALAYARNIDNLSATERFEKGYGLSISGNNADAINAFSTAIELNPQFALAYRNRGIAHVIATGILDNYSHALKDFDKAIELNPQYAEAYYSRGLVHGNLGNYQRALKDYTKAIELDPQYAEAYNNRGVAYMMVSNYQQALKDYNKAIELNPQSAEVYNNRGAVYVILSNYQQSLMDYDKAVELNPRYAKAYYNIACIYSLKNDAAQSCKWLKTSIEKGYNDWKQIKSDRDLDLIRNSQCYKEIMADN